MRSFQVRTANLRMSEMPDWVSPTLVGLPAGQVVARLDERSWLDRFWWVFADVPNQGAFEGYVDKDCLEPLTTRARQAAPAPADSFDYPGRIIRSGERDARLVNDIQARLRELLDETAFTPDQYDDLLTAAVCEFQAAQPERDGAIFTVDGDVGPKTWAALFAPDARSLKGAQQGITLARRENGTALPISSERLPEAFGAFTHRPDPAKRGAIIISDDWRRRNLVRATIPLVRPTPTIAGRVTLHRRLVGPLRRVMMRIRAAGLSDRVVTTWAPWCARHKNWNPNKGLSSHSWGVGIDINDRWNGPGVTPPPVGEEGSVRELIPFFLEEGFAWGGDFTSPIDGMHFELARTDWLQTR